MRWLGSIRIAVIGPATAHALGQYGLRADLIPRDVYRAESLVEDLKSHAAGRRFLLARASRGREVLAEGLREADAVVDQVVVYQSQDVQDLAPDVATGLEQGRIDYVTVTSSAIARSLYALLGEQLLRTKLVSISPVTSQTLRELGLEPAVEASSYTMVGVVEAIRQDVA